MYTATNEPAQTTKQFEIRTAQGLARFLACTKCFRDGFYRNGRTGHWVPMNDFKFPIAGAHCKIQKGCPRKSGKFPNFKTKGNRKRIHLNVFYHVHTLRRCLVSPNWVELRWVVGVHCSNLCFGRIWAGHWSRNTDRIPLSAEVLKLLIVDQNCHQIGHCSQLVYYCKV